MRFRSVYLSLAEIRRAKCIIPGWLGCGIIWWWDVVVLSRGTYGNMEYSTKPTVDRIHLWMEVGKTKEALKNFPVGGALCLGHDSCFCPGHVLEKLTGNRVGDFGWYCLVDGHEMDEGPSVKNSGILWVLRGLAYHFIIQQSGCILRVYEGGCS
ncbi:hypothetical protein E3N88_13439 [Mikania micrantha]|uniref:Uncharacterized protein n=1 Tax=Mikania micrantha TaxID=192012 RepID=A0A5N6P8H8_9ASTR|nr:hypothetical protein E3N88_13439 [Mikania micrantha]